MNDRPMSEKIRVTGLWTNQSKAGNRYLSGTMGGVKVLIFPVKERKGENSPTHELFFCPNEKRDKPKADDTPTPWDD